MTPPIPRTPSCASCAQRFRRATDTLRDRLHRAPIHPNRRLHWVDDDDVPLCDTERTRGMLRISTEVANLLAQLDAEQ